MAKQIKSPMIEGGITFKEYMAVKSRVEAVRGDFIDFLMGVSSMERNADRPHGVPAFINTKMRIYSYLEQLEQSMMHSEVA